MLRFIAFTAVSVAAAAIKDSTELRFNSKCIKFDGEEHCIKDITCRGVSYDSMTSSSQSSSGLKLTVSGLNFNCDGQYSHNGAPFEGFEMGLAACEVSIPLFVSDESFVPAVISYSESCRMTATRLDGTSFYDGNAKAVQSFSRAVGELIIGILNDNRDVMRETAKARFNSHASNNSPLPTKSEFVTWSSDMLQLLTDLRVKYPFDGIKTIASLLTGESETVRFALGDGVSMSWPFGQSCLFSATISEMSFIGLDAAGKSADFDHAESQSATLRVSVPIDSLGVSAPVQLSLSCDDTHQSLWDDVVILNAQMKDVMVKSDIKVALTKDKIYDLYLDQLAHPACVMRAFDAVVLQDISFKMAVEKAWLTNTNDVTAVLNDVLEFGTPSFASLVDDIIQGMAQGPLKDSLNQLMVTRLASLPPCPEHVIASGPPEFVKWTGDEASQAIEDSVSDLLKSFGLDDKIIAAGKIHFEDFFEGVVDALLGWDSFSQTAYSRMINVRSSSSAVAQINSTPVASIGSCEEADGCLYLKSHWYSPSISAPSMPFLPAIMTTSLSAANDFYVDFGIVAKLDINKVKNLQYKDILLPQCVISAFDDVSVTELMTRKPLDSSDVDGSLDLFLSYLPSNGVLDGVNVGLKEILYASEQACSTGVWPGRDSMSEDVSLNPKDIIHRKKTDVDCTAAVDPIECVIQNIIIGPLNETCVEISTGDTLCIDEFTCSGMDVKGVPSAYIPPTTFQLGIAGLTLPCSAKWTMSGVDGTASLSINDLTSDVQLTTATEGIYPVAVSVADCTVSNIDISIHFSGKNLVINGILNGLVWMFENTIENAVSKLICEKLDQAIADGITKLLEVKIDPALEEIIAYGPSEPAVCEECVDWKTSPLEAIHMLLESVESSTGDLLDCFADSNPSYGDLKISKLIQLMTDEGGLTVEIDKLIQFGNEASLYLDTLAVTGLNTIEEVKLLQPSNTSSITLVNELVLDSFQLSLTAQLRVGAYAENIKIDFQLTDVTMLLDLDLGVNGALFHQLYMDQLTHFSCWQSTVEVLTVSSFVFDLTVAHLDYVQVSGDSGPLETDLAEMVDNFFVMCTEGYGDLLTAVVKGIAQGPIRSAINVKLADHLANRAVCPDHVDISGPPNWISWTESKLIGIIDLVLDDLLGASGLNSIISCATNGTGMATLTKDGAFSLTLSGLNSLYDFNILMPVASQPYELYNSIGIGYCPNSADCNPFGLDFKGTLKGKPFELKLILENTALSLGLLIEMNQNDVANLQLQTFEHKGCKMTTMDALSVYDLDLTASRGELIINGQRQIDQNITKILDMIFGLLSGDKTVAKINSKLAQKMEESVYVCADAPIPDSTASASGADNDIKWQLPLIYAAVGLICTIIIGLHYYYFAGDKLSAWRFLYRENIVQYLYPVQWKKYMLDSTLIFNPNIPLIVRVFVPLLIWGTISLFIYSNQSYAVDVIIDINVADNTIEPDPIFSFSLSNTVSDMWEAKVYPLAILIAFFSGAWPYVKLMVMFAAWIIPPSIFDLSIRETALIALDVLGKWSLIDAYVMVLMMVAFHVELIIADNLSVMVLVKAKAGFYTFVAATIASLVLGHVVLYYHHYVIEMKQAPPEDTPSAIMNSKFIVKSRKSIMKVTRAGKIAMVLLFAFVALFIVAGTFEDTFKFVFKGLVGYMLGSAADPSYSLVSVGESLPDSSGLSNDPGVIFLQSSFMMFGVGMPLLLMALLTILWVVPMSLKMQQRLFLFSEVSNAWSAVDVFVVSIVAALLEIQQFAAFIVGDSCDGINEWLKENMDEELDGDDKCFDVVATLKTVRYALKISKL
jgi:hypothetical protein